MGIVDVFLYREKRWMYRWQCRLLERVLKSGNFFAVRPDINCGVRFNNLLANEWLLKRLIFPNVLIQGGVSTCVVKVLQLSLGEE
ncbi:MAG: hypothetical protein BWY80_00054 [Firmicutes bacterium ADurb.Bin456]|nr:MAG: hypothetical protein BWY80_00054 [Firmicutes bacterium ADurb.Bin456]